MPTLSKAQADKCEEAGEVRDGRETRCGEATAGGQPDERK